MTVKKCDRCGKIYHNWEQGSGYLDLHLVGDVDHADLCCECAEALREFIRKQATDKDNLVEKGGVNPPECKYCKYLVKAAEDGWIGKCGNKNSSFYHCLRDAYNTCEWQEDKNNEY